MILTYSNKLLKVFTILLVIGMFIIYFDYKNNPQYYYLLTDDPGYPTLLIEHGTGLLSYYEIVPEQYFNDKRIFVYYDVDHTWRPIIETPEQKAYIPLVAGFLSLYIVLLGVIYVGYFRFRE